jgi:hypothetical protein
MLLTILNNNENIAICGFWLFCWLILSFIVGSLGKNREIGFAASFIISIFVSPLIGFIIVIGSKRKSDAEFQKKILELETERNELLKKDDRIKP